MQPLHKPGAVLQHSAETLQTMPHGPFSQLEIRPDASSVSQDRREPQFLQARNRREARKKEKQTKFVLKSTNFHNKFQDTYTPIVNSNLQMINSVKDQIQDSYNNLIRMLELEKNQLMQRVIECESDNKKFNVFKNEINDMKRNLNDFREETAM
jgi:hypothetical protein